MKKRLINYRVNAFVMGTVVDTHQTDIQGDAYSAYLSMNDDYPEAEVEIRGNGVVIMKTHKWGNGV